MCTSGTTYRMYTVIMYSHGHVLYKSLVNKLHQNIQHLLRKSIRRRHIWVDLYILTLSYYFFSYALLLVMKPTNCAGIFKCTLYLIIN